MYASWASKKTFNSPINIPSFFTVVGCSGLFLVVLPVALMLLTYVLIKFADGTGYNFIDRECECEKAAGHAWHFCPVENAVFSEHLLFIGAVFHSYKMIGLWDHIDKDLGP